MENISVVIPAYNEKERIKSTLKRIIDYLSRRYKYEIIIVDDGSSDETASIVKDFARWNKGIGKRIILLRNSKNMGKGHSVRRGIMHAKYPLILFSDADLSTPIEELDKFIAFLGNYDIVIASRNLKESNIKLKQPSFRVLLGKTFPLLVNLVLMPEIKDTQCGFKLFKKDAARKIFKVQTLNRFSFDAEVLYIARKKGYNIKEAPVTWINMGGSKVNLLFDPIRMFLDVFRIRLNDILGEYQK